MPKILTRIVAFALIPSLLADPASATATQSILRQPLSPAVAPPPAFQRQALLLPLAASIYAGLARPEGFIHAYHSLVVLVSGHPEIVLGGTAALGMAAQRHRTKRNTTKIKSKMNRRSWLKLAGLGGAGLITSLYVTSNRNESPVGISETDVRKKLTAAIEQLNGFQDEIPELILPASFRPSISELIKARETLVQTIRTAPFQTLPAGDPSTFSIAWVEPIHYQVNLSRLDALTAQGSTDLFHELIHATDTHIQAVRQAMNVHWNKLETGLALWFDNQRIQTEQNRLGRSMTANEIVSVGYWDPKAFDDSAIYETSRDFLSTFILAELEAYTAGIALQESRARDAQLTLEEYLKSQIRPFAQARGLSIEQYIAQTESSGEAPDIGASGLLGDLLQRIKGYQSGMYSSEIAVKAIRSVLSDPANGPILSAMVRHDLGNDFPFDQVDLDDGVTLQFDQWAFKTFLHMKKMPDGTLVPLVGPSSAGPAVNPAKPPDRDRHIFFGIDSPQNRPTNRDPLVGPAIPGEERSGRRHQMKTGPHLPGSEMVRRVDDANGPRRSPPGSWKISEGAAFEAQRILNRVREGPMRVGSIKKALEPEVEKIHVALEQNGVPSTLARRMARQIIFKLGRQEGERHLIWEALSDALLHEMQSLREMQLRESQIILILPKMSAADVQALSEQLRREDAEIARTILQEAFSAANPVDSAAVYLANYKQVLAHLEGTAYGEIARMVANASFIAPDPIQQAERCIARYQKVLLHLKALGHPELAGTIAASAFGSSNPIAQADIYLDNYKRVVAHLNEKADPEIARSIASVSFSAPNPLAQADLLTGRYQEIAAYIESTGDPEIARTIADTAFKMSDGLKRADTYLANYRNVIAYLKSSENPEIARSIALAAFKATDPLKQADILQARYRELLTHLEGTLDAKIARSIASASFTASNPLRQGNIYRANYNQVVKYLRQSADPEIARMVAHMAYRAPKPLDKADQLLAQYKAVLDYLHTKADTTIAGTIAAQSFSAAKPLEKAEKLFAAARQSPPPDAEPTPLEAKLNPAEILSDIYSLVSFVSFPPLTWGTPAELLAQLNQRREMIAARLTRGENRQTAIGVVIGAYNIPLALTAALAQAVAAEDSRTRLSGLQAVLDQHQLPRELASLILWYLGDRSVDVPPGIHAWITPSRVEPASRSGDIDRRNSNRGWGERPMWNPLGDSGGTMRTRSQFGPNAWRSERRGSRDAEDGDKSRKLPAKSTKLLELSAEAKLFATTLMAFTRAGRAGQLQIQESYDPGLFARASGILLYGAIFSRLATLIRLAKPTIGRVSLSRQVDVAVFAVDLPDSVLDTSSPAKTPGQKNLTEWHYLQRGIESLGGKLQFDASRQRLELRIPLVDPSATAAASLKIKPSRMAAIVRRGGFAWEILDAIEKLLPGARGSESGYPAEEVLTHATPIQNLPKQMAGGELLSEAELIAKGEAVRSGDLDGKVIRSLEDKKALPDYYGEKEVVLEDLIYFQIGEFDEDYAGAFQAGLILPTRDAVPEGIGNDYPQSDISAPSPVPLKHAIIVADIRRKQQLRARFAKLIEQKEPSWTADEKAKEVERFMAKILWLEVDRSLNEVMYRLMHTAEGTVLLNYYFGGSNPTVERADDAEPGSKSRKKPDENFADRADENDLHLSRLETELNRAQRLDPMDPFIRIRIREVHEMRLKKSERKARSLPKFVQEQERLIQDIATFLTRFQNLISNESDSGDPFHANAPGETPRPGDEMKKNRSEEGWLMNKLMLTFAPVVGLAAVFFSPLIRGLGGDFLSGLRSLLIIGSVVLGGAALGVVLSAGLLMGILHWMMRGHRTGSGMNKPSPMKRNRLRLAAAA
jgi:hypothetical protein